MNRKEYYIIQNKDNKFLELEAGGYPWFAEDFEICKRFNSKESAEDFLKNSYVGIIFKEELKDCIIRKIIITIE